MKTVELIIKHLNGLISKYQLEIDLLTKMKNKPTNELHQAEIDINIAYFEEEIKEIKDILEELENEEQKYVLIPMNEIPKGIRINPMDYASTEQEKLILSSIEDVNFSDNTIYKLKACEIFTVLELISFSKDEIKMYRNLGKKSLKEIEEFMSKNNLSWGFTLNNK